MSLAEFFGYLMIGLCLVIFLIIPLAMFLRMVEQNARKKRMWKEMERHDQPRW